MAMQFSINNKMMGRVSLIGAAMLATIAASNANAAKHPVVIRWTGAESTNSSIENLLNILSAKTNHTWTQSDFLLSEDRDLAFNHYKRYVQIVDGVPVHGGSIRVWTDNRAGTVVQVEAAVDTQLEARLATSSSFWSLNDPTASLSRLTPKRTAAIARAAVLASLEDPNIRGIQSSDEWRDGELVRVVQVRGKRGKHSVIINARTQRVVATEYREFPQAETAIDVQVYPIYEEVEGDGTKEVLPRMKTQLKHVLTTVPQVSSDVFAPLKTQHYLWSKHDFTLGATPQGQAQGYWSMAVVKQNAAKLVAGLPQLDNTFANGLLLQGRYTSINIHPDALKKYSPWSFTAQPTAAFLPNWIEGDTDAEMFPSQAYAGKPIFSAQEAFDRPARRLPDHDPKAYLADGFDEIQVYYAVDTLFEELHARGFTDPELSTRPFNAFLFNPDISMRDNAFYTDDTINFTTYSPKAQNFARDNSTIWHELGHGVMDRLMGDSIELADTGGLSEGMADFVGAILVQAVTQGTPFPGSTGFRIINKTGFNLTNEVHDDGEAYGGTMKDFLDLAIAAYGNAGLDKVTDVVLEAMRLTRDYPGLTAADWFKHIQFADSLGRPGVRAPGELGPLLLQALASRNFKLDGGVTASFTLVNTNSNAEVVAGKPGSRQSPILVEIPKTDSAHFELTAQVKNSDTFSFKFPVTVKALYNGGPIEGAIHWVGEEKGAQQFTLTSSADVAKIPLTVTGTCDEVNRDDGSCVDYLYVQVINAGETRPAAKKRFYLRVKN
jgi:hypothetical protein